MGPGDKAVIFRADNPLRRGDTQKCAFHSEGDNPLCGDSISIGLDMSEDGRIIKAVFDGYACSLCRASADLLLELVDGQTVEYAQSLTSSDIIDAWGGMHVGRMRAKCMDLPLKVMRRVLNGSEGQRYR